MDDLPLAGYVTECGIEDERPLVCAARSDPAAFAALYQRYVTPVYRYLYKWVGSRAEAEDLTSQVFTEVLEGLMNYRERGKFAAWLFTIARRKAIAAYRRRRREVRLGQIQSVSGSNDDPLDDMLASEQRERMAALFANLRDDQRELLRLRFTARLGYAEIGLVLGRSEAAIKMAIRRLLQRMHDNWEEK